MINKKISFFGSLCLFCSVGIIGTHSNAWAQGISLDDQKKIDIINTWVQNQIKKGNVPTQSQMDSINNVVVANYKPEKQKSSLPKFDSIAGKTSVVIKKQCMPGGSLTVPENKIWKVLHVYVTEGIGGSYNVLVGSVKFEKELVAGEKLLAPVWAAETNLLSNDASSLMYIFEIEEKEATTKK